MHSRCLCLAGKIRSVGGRIKHNGSTDKERSHDSTRLGDRQATHAGGRWGGGDWKGLPRVEAYRMDGI